MMVPYIILKSRVNRNNKILVFISQVLFYIPVYRGGLTTGKASSNMGRAKNKYQKLKEQQQRCNISTHRLVTYSQNNNSTSQQTVLGLQQLTVTVEPFRVGAPSDTVKGEKSSQSSEFAWKVEGDSFPRLPCRRLRKSTLSWTQNLNKHPLTCHFILKFILLVSGWIFFHL